MDNNKSIYGFTIIELLIVIAVVGLFSALSLASYNSFNSQKSLEADTRKVESALNLVRKQAIAGDKSNTLSNATCASTESLVSYSLAFTGSTYTLYRTCSISGKQTVATYTLATNDVFVGSGEIIFAALTGITQNLQNITIKNSVQSSQLGCFRLTVLESGIVDEQGPQSSFCTGSPTF